MEHDAENRKYVDTCVKPLFEKMMLEVIVKKPSNVIEFLKDWLSTKGTQFMTSSQIKKR